MLYLDLETCSEVDLKEYGAYAYAEHLSTSIVLLAYAVDDGPIHVHEGIPDEFRRLYGTMPIVAHNCHFENALLVHCARMEQLSSDLWVDTMTIANSIAYPAGLGALCDALDTSSKMEDGKTLVRMFSKPGKDKESHPEEWERYKEYNRIDVEVLREAFKLLPKNNYHRKEYQDEWNIDWLMNTRGVLCDIDFCKKMLPLVTKRGAYVNERLSALTEGRVTSVGQIQRIVREVEGIENLQAETVEKALLSDSLTPVEREVLLLRAEAGKASVKKYTGFLNRANRDGRVRGFMVLYGASRTGRYSSKGVQLHNLVKPTLSWKDIQTSIDRVMRDDDIPVEEVFEIATSSLRSVIIPDPLHLLLVTDLAQIEARVLAWLAGQEDALEVFASGKDIYIATAAKMYHLPYASITDAQRFEGKTAVLALGFGQGVTGFVGFCEKLKIPMTEERAMDIVTAWRDANPRIVSYWKAVENAVRRVIYSPDAIVSVRGKLMVRNADGDVHIVLPSGRHLVYPKAFIRDGDIGFKGKHATEWTYGGKLAENVTQATARDIMAANLPLMEAAGYPVLLTVHDEVISQKSILDPTRSIEELSSILATRPHWALDLPLKAEGFQSDRYRK